MAKILQRIVLGISYKGSAYCGWQIQKHNTATIQHVVETAIAKIANHPVQIIASGRTDAGVHATAQIIHFDTYTKRKSFTWITGTNHHLPQDIKIIWAREISNDFHARFSAIKRSYNYWIYASPVASPLYYEHALWVYYKLDLSAMNKALQAMVGEHDFSAYRSSKCQAKTPVRRVFSANITKNDDFYIAHITANAFLHHMVRNIMGTVIAVGAGKISLNDAYKMLQFPTRTTGSPTSASCGLYLSQVIYPAHFNLP